MTIRATTPKKYNPNTHSVIEFKRINYPSPYKILSNGRYRYQGHSAESSIEYTEEALLALSNVEIIKIK